VDKEFVLSINEILNTTITVGGIIIAVLMWVIKKEVTGFRNEASTSRGLIANNLSNHIENDEKFQDRVEKHLDRVHMKLDKIIENGKSK
jgi:hypothetical protein